MKKSFFLLGVAVAAMTSCSNDKLLDQAEPIQRAIGFDSFVNKTTKAVTATDGNITQFYALGYYGETSTTSNGVTTYTSTTVFDNIPVSRTNTQATEWNYTDTKYWTKNLYCFAGYADANLSNKLLNPDFENSTLSISDYIVNDANDLVADVIKMDNTSYGQINTKVVFDFKHLLTKIQFKVINTDDKYRMKIVEPLTITGIKTKGSVTYTESQTWSAIWKPSNDSGTRNDVQISSDDYIPIRPTNPTDGDNTGIVSSEDYLVMPQALSSITYSIKVEFYDDLNQIVSEKVLSGDLAIGANNDDVWAPGYAYLYTIQLPTATKPIEFGTPTFTDWDITNVTTPIELNTGDTGENGMTGNTPENSTQG